MLRKALIAIAMAVMMVTGVLQASGSASAAPPANTAVAGKVVPKVAAKGGGCTAGFSKPGYKVYYRVCIYQSKDRYLRVYVVQDPSKDSPSWKVGALRLIGCEVAKDQGWKCRPDRPYRSNTAFGDAKYWHNLLKRPAHKFTGNPFEGTAGRPYRAYVMMDAVINKTGKKISFRAWTPIQWAGN